MAESDKIVTISEAKELMPSSFPSASGDELNRCPTKSELVSNGFTINTGSNYENNQCVIKGDLGGYDITYTISNESVQYSSLGMLDAGGTNFAWITATVTKKQGGTVLWSSGVTANVQHTGSESYMSVSSDTYIKASNRGTTTGGTRTGKFKGYYEGVYSNELTVTQAANTSLYNELTTSLTYRTLIATPNAGGGVYSYQGRELVSSDQGRYYAECQRGYKYWTSYSSGAGSETGTTTGFVTATSFTFNTSVSWARSYSSDLKQITVDQNVGTTNRTATTVTAQYDDKSSTFTLEQWRSPSSTTETRVTSVSPTSLTWLSNESGTTKAKEITATFQYAISNWKNGSTTTGSWTNYTPSSAGGTNAPSARINGQYGTHFMFHKYDGTTAYDMNFYYPSQSSTQGKIRIYPYNANSENIVKSADVYQYYTSPYSSIATLSHEGAIAFDIDPESLSFTYNGGTKVITVTTEATDWTISENAGWFSATKNGNEVTVVVDANTNTANTRSDYVRFMSGTTEITKCKVEQQAAPAPTGTTVEGIYKLFELSDGWIVGYYISAKSTSPCNWNARTLVIARNDAGSNTTFSLTGHYDTHMCGTDTNVNWSTSSKTYTAGTKLTGTALPGETQWDCYGFSIGGGPEANTQKAYAGISII